MTMVSAVSQVRMDPYQQLVEELRIELRCADVGALADRIVEAEAADFHWSARVRERYLGQFTSADLDFESCDEELVRVAIMSFLGGRWHAASCIVDGEGRVLDLLWLQSFEDVEEAETAFMRSH